MDHTKRAKCIIIHNHTTAEYEECTAEEWDQTNEMAREFVNFKDGRGFIFARPAMRHKDE